MLNINRKRIHAAAADGCHGMKNLFKQILLFINSKIYIHLHYLY